MSASNYVENKLLDAVFNASTTGGGLPTADTWMQLHNGDPGETGATNVVSIGRVQVEFETATNGSVTNPNDIDFVNMPVDQIVAWSFWDSAGSGTPPTGGNCLWTGWFSTIDGLATVLGSNTFTSNDHGLINDDRVVFEQYGDIATPTGVTLGQIYYVLDRSDDTFTVSDVKDGSVEVLTSDGQVVWHKVIIKTPNLNDTLRIPVGEMDIYLD